jgi:endonuclease/exonuclease/phosphatase family metal-dependent hydrolase
MHRSCAAILAEFGRTGVQSCMRLVTWNIQWGCGVDGRVDLRRIVDGAQRLADFDVLCLQEVADNRPDLDGNDERDQFAELRGLLPGYAAAESISVDEAGDGGRRRRFGNLLFSRYSILAVRRHALPWPADPGKDTVPRSALEATLQAPMGPVRVTTTHLEYYSDLQRRAQALRLRHLQDEAGHRQSPRSILVGDFNFPVDDAAYAEIQAPFPSGVPGYRDAWRLAHGHRPHAPTFCVHTRVYSKTPYCCDFAFVSEDLAARVRDVRVDGDTRASDHQPLLLELDDR